MKKLSKYLRELIFERRVLRKGSFLFLPNSTSLPDLLNLFFLEMRGKGVEADKYSISLLAEDLISKNIILEKSINHRTFRIGELIYHDVQIKTSDNLVYSRGTSTDYGVAFGKAFGEVLERTISKFPMGGEAAKIEIKELGNLNFAKPTKKQIQTYPNFNFSASDKFEMLATPGVPDAGYLPVQTIFRYRPAGEKEILQPSTHGAGAGFSAEDAYNSAFFEILHRHFFLNSWYKKLSPKILDLETIPENSDTKNLKNKIKNLEKTGYKIHLLDFTSEAHIPTFICLLEKFGGVYCGGATKLLATDAVERALDEAVSIYMYVTESLASGQGTITQEVVDSVQGGFVDKTLTDGRRTHLFGNSFFWKAKDKFILKGEKINFSESVKFENQYEKSCEYLQKLFKQIYFYNFQSDLGENYNYYVTKVIIPDSYIFALHEIYSRPILSDRVEPLNQSPNPFP